jgi:Tfp pilus assembly protein PilV
MQEFGSHHAAAGRPRPWAGNAGVSLVEILVASLVIGVSVIALSLMFANGSAWVSAMGDDRVAAGLAQQRIEQIRSAGWSAAMAAPGITPPESDVDAAGCSDLVSNPQCRRTVKYTRVTCIQYVDPSSPNGLNTPAYTTDCPAGAASSTKRITVTVTPVFAPAAGGDQPVMRAQVVTVQGWITQAGP